MAAHKHAESMRQYAEDAAETPVPWERWQCRDSNVPNSRWCELEGHPGWYADMEYRRAPKPVEFWALLYEDGSTQNFATREKAEAMQKQMEGSPYSFAARIVHMREVIE